MTFIPLRKNNGTSGKPQVNGLPKQVELPCGSTKRHSLAAIAYTAARKLTRAGGARMTLTLDPAGLAFLEPPAVACFEDSVGTYEGTRPFTMEKLILDDLKHFVELKGDLYELMG